jgi:hypothetical protein
VFFIHPEGVGSAADGTGEPCEGFGEEWKRVIVVNGKRQKSHSEGGT